MTEGRRVAARGAGPLRARRPRLSPAAWVAVASWLVVGALLAFGRSPALVERLFAGGAGQALARAVAGLTGRVPFGLAEPVAVAVALWLLVPLVRAVRDVARRRRAAGPALVAELLRLVVTAGVGVAIFYAAWGLNYARLDLEVRLGWEGLAAPVAQAEATEELAKFAGDLVEATNAAYREATATPDLGVPSGADLDLAALDRALDSGYVRAAALLGAEPGFSAPRGPAKPVLASDLMSRLGVSGVYFPWTGEANYNRLVPRAQLPLVIAHEKAHQRGIASEDEANFVGYVASALADDPYARYSGLLFAQRQLLFELQERDPERAEALLDRRLPGVQRDVDAAREFWARYEGPLREVQTRSNDTYLKLNGVEEGVASYDRSAELILLFARANGGDPEPRASVSEAG